MTLPIPFATTDQCWFWVMNALRAREQGMRKEKGVVRPCSPDDVIRCVDTLYRRRSIDLTHARVLRIWGERGRVPLVDSGDSKVWQDAISRLDPILRAKGIVA